MQEYFNNPYYQFHKNRLERIIGIFIELLFVAEGQFRLFVPPSFRMVVPMRRVLEGCIPQ